MKNIRIFLATTTAVLFALVAISSGHSATAQSATAQATQVATVSANPSCTPGTLIKSLSAIKSTNDKAKDMDALLKLRDQIDAQYAACDGLFFKGTGNKAIGPITLDSGTYQVHLVTSGYFILDLKVISGTCSSNGDTTSVFIITGGQATDGADITLDSNGCRVLLLPSNISAPWTLAMTLLQ